MLLKVNYDGDMSEDGSKSKTSHSPDRFLDAAESVILRESIGRLTLDAVATEANASKGGLLHHFPSKEKLIEAMVHRIVSNWRTQTFEAIEKEPPGRGRIPRAIMKAAFDRPCEFSEDCKRNSTVLIAALVACPTLVQPMRDFEKELYDMVASDGLTPGVGEAVLLAIDGLWMKWIFDTFSFDESRSKGLRQALDRLLEADEKHHPAAFPDCCSPQRSI